MIDTHCHVHDTVRGPDGWESVKSLGARTLITMGVRPDDWDQVAEGVAACPSKVRGGYGIHPWFAHRFAASIGDWLEDQRARLKADPTSIVGEIGLDKVAITVDTKRNEFALQLPVFEAQLDLAAEMGRPVSVHCVRAHGYLLDFFRARSMAGRLPPAIALHSFGGSPDIVKSLIKLPGGAGRRLFFGFSACINTRNEDKTRELIALIPEDRILLETDREGVGARCTFFGFSLTMAQSPWTRSL